MKKERIDKLLFEKGLVPSREKAKALIMAGKVFIKAGRIEKPGQLVDVDAPLEIKKPSTPYVSRAGVKLEKALHTFGISVSQKIALDVGASTGGFTDCLIQHGARLVYAVDVGYGQMDPKIAQNSKVIIKDRVNLRYATQKDFPCLFDLITIDVSFISLRLILPVAKKLLTSGGEIICLVKPQFEIGKGQVGKGGIIRDPQKHARVLWKIIHFAQEQNLFFSNVVTSPITGAKGNKEFLLYLVSYGEKTTPEIIKKALKKEKLPV